MLSLDATEKINSLKRNRWIQSFYIFVSFNYFCKYVFIVPPLAAFYQIDGNNYCFQIMVIAKGEFNNQRKMEILVCNCFIVTKNHLNMSIQVQCLTLGSRSQGLTAVFCKGQNVKYIRQETYRQNSKCYVAAYITA